MIKSFRVRLDANAAKVAALDAVLAEWQCVVRGRIDIFWALPKEAFNTHRAAIDMRLGSSLIRRATDSAWRIAKGAKRNLQPKPEYAGSGIDYDESSCRLSFNNDTTFDGWLEVQTLVKGRRAALPFKSFGRLNESLARGKLSKGVTLMRGKRGWFAQIVITVEAKPNIATKTVGVDVGVRASAATSTGRLYGEELHGLRKRTRHRQYRSVAKMPYRQGLNRVAKEIVADHPQSDFACEVLNFKGEHKRTKLFRSRLHNFAYLHLAARLEDLGHTEGFSVFKVNPAYTSQTCPECGYVNKGNRNGDSFRCLKCDHAGHADVVAAINIANRKEIGPVGRGSPTSSHPNPASRVSGDIQCPDQKGVVLDNAAH